MSLYPRHRLAVTLVAAWLPVAAAVGSLEPLDGSRPPELAPGGSPRMPDAGGPPDGADCRRPWVEPVDAAVVDPFRPPDRVYGPGNRGIEYGVEPGQPVVAVDGGVVAFAGPVAGSPVVVIDHGGGLRSSFVHLADRSVGRGEVVSRGRAIGSAGPGFHLGARVGGRYIDPAELVDRRCEVVRLVPP